MNMRCGSLLSGLALLVFVSAPLFAQDEPEMSQMKYKSYPKWNIVLPKETFTPVAGKLPIAHSGGEGFEAVIDGTALSIDANGDGKVGDVKAKGTGGLVTLKGETADGKKLYYTARLVNNGTWSFATSGAMVGKVAGTEVQLIDQNNNGRYNDFGEDAMIVGNGDAASFLSKVISIKGELFEIDVNANGDEVTVRPFQGETGVLNLYSGFESKGKLAAAVVVSVDGANSFELAGDRKGLTVPVGQYRIASGLILKGKETVKVRAGKSRPVTVAANDESVVEWGGPLRAEFTYARQGDKVTFDPQNLWFYGKMEEEYYEWVPDGKPPKFVIADKRTGREVAEAKFGGC
ncbi:MAG: hypothetical protein KDB53_00960 [Planctomycetes bacterium]|nr:hypothetical protein [Planctomycetota bacterium]